MAQLSFRRLLLVVAGIVLASYSLAAAQSAPEARVTGSVFSQGTAVPGAVVRAESTAGGQVLSTITDEQGRYVLPLPGPGTYRLRVEMFGFAPAQRSVVLVAEEDAVRADFHLALAGSAEQSTAEQPGETAAPAQSPPPAEAQKPAPATRLKQPAALSADIPMEFVFVTGQLAQPAGAAESSGIGVLRQRRFHGSVSYTAGNSALNAAPYALHGIPAEKPEYAQNSFSASAGGTLRQTMSLFGDYSGSRSASPFNGFATVPTEAQRKGEFSGATIYDPVTGLPFAGNSIPEERMSAAALGLLKYFPLPNRAGDSQNFHFVSANDTASDAFGLSFTRVSSAIAQSGTKDAPVRHNFSARFGYRRSESNLSSVFPLLGGDSASHGWNASAAHTIMKGFFASSLRAEFSDSRATTRNRFHQDEAALLGVQGVSRDSFDWGLPAVALTHFTGLRDIAPRLRTDRSIKFADTLSWTNGKHNLKWGGDFRRQWFDTRTSDNARGAFTFTGFATANIIGGIPAPGTGMDFADFLLGLPQQTRLQYSGGTWSFAGNSWSLFFVDDWRVAKNVTINLGVRYEYSSPLTEQQNRLVTLDLPADFSSVTLLRAGEPGVPAGIVSPDRNNIAPRIGLAWRASEHFIVRSGYSVNYNPGLYNMLAMRLAFQPPFATRQIGIASGDQPLTLANGFPALSADDISNDFGVKRDLPLGYVQIWVLEVQRELPAGIALTAAYTGTKGTHLENYRAPNRTATGLRWPDVEPFLWQSADGSSILHAGSLRLRKRLQRGVSLGASYMFSRSIDDVPGLGGGGAVPQDELHPEAERGLSSFDQRHRLTADYMYELPFGRGKRWLSEAGFGNRLFGNWAFSGTVRYATGMPLTARVLGDFTEVNRGGYGALRANATGQPIEISGPTMDRYFNTAAFVLPPPGQYGSAGRNTITGPSLWGADASLQKALLFSEGRILEIRAQISNLFNSPQFTMVDTAVNSPSYGQVVAVGPMRMVQLSLRYRF